jgi:tRNA (cytosine38-C5)-methyltransferase
MVLGGMHLALKRSNVEGTVVRSYDFDKIACQVYSLNHSDVILKADISKLEADSLAALHADLWLMSPPCQPYTVLSSRGGTTDPRAWPFVHLIKTLLPDLASKDAHPRFMIIENVAGFEVIHFFWVL